MAAQLLENRLFQDLVQQEEGHVAKDEQHNEHNRPQLPEFLVQCRKPQNKQKAAIVDGLGGAKADINRSKGLGENDPEMMWLTTMNPDTRKLIRVMPEDVERTAQMFDLLLGDNLAGRKAHIAECGSQFLDLADIS